MPKSTPKAGLIEIVIKYLFLFGSISLSLFLTACSISADVATQSSTSLESGMPKFSGPWAEEFRTRYSLAPNPEIQSFLADEQITEIEMQVVTENFRNCMQGNQLTFTNFDVGGGFDFGFPENMGASKANEIADTCSSSSGVNAIIHLYYQLRSNPTNKDRSEEIVSCIIRAGIVPSNFSVKDYRTYPITELALVDEDTAVSAVQFCEADPSGTFVG
jgi:hypothetical protein